MNTSTQILETALEGELANLAEIEGRYASDAAYYERTGDTEALSAQSKERAHSRARILELRLRLKATNR